MFPFDVSAHSRFGSLNITKNKHLLCKECDKAGGKWVHHELLIVVLKFTSLGCFSRNKKVIEVSRSAWKIGILGKEQIGLQKGKRRNRWKREHRSDDDKCSE